MSIRSFSLIAMSFAPLAGCQSASLPDVPAEISAATLAGEPIRFQTESLAIDAADVSSAALSLPDAITMALRNDPTLQASLARVRVALADARQARLLPNPVLDVVFRFPEGGGKTIVDLGLSADLVALLKLGRSVSAADHRLQAAGRDALTTALETVRAVQDAYVTLQSLDAQVAILGERQNINRRLIDLANDRVNAGESPRLDVLTLTAQQAELETEAIQKEAEQTDQRLILSRLLGQPSSGSDWKLPVWTAPVAVNGAQRDWIETALAKRPELQSKAWELAALGDDAAISAAWVFYGASAGGAAERDPDWSVGPAVSVPIPIFDMGQAKKERARAAVIVARHELAQAQRQTIEEVRRAWAAVQASTRALARVQQQLLPAQQKRREQAEIAYRNGAADIITVLIAEQDLQTSRAKLIEVQRDVSLAVIRLERAVGGAGVVEKIRNRGASQTAENP